MERLKKYEICMPNDIIHNLDEIYNLLSSKSFFDRGRTRLCYIEVIKNSTLHRSVCSVTSCTHCLFRPKNFKSLTKLMFSPLSDVNSLIPLIFDTIRFALLELVNDRIRMSEEGKEIIKSKGKYFFEFRLPIVMRDMNVIISNFTLDKMLEIIKALMDLMFKKEDIINE